MKTKFFTPILFLIFYSFATVCEAQVKTKIFHEGIPYSLIPQKTDNIRPTLVTAPSGFSKLLNADISEIKKAYSNSFASPKDVDIDFIENATVIEGRGFTTFIMMIHAEGAMNMSFEFDEFNLSENSVLSLYTNNEITETITSRENNPDNIWATRVYQGNMLTISLKVPLNEKGKVRINIDKLNFGFKKFGTNYFGNAGASSGCNINVVCPAGNDWGDERNSIGMIVISGVEQCTGSLVMNTCSTNRPYFLTADHCLGGSLANWVFQFQTWSATCVGNTGWLEDVQFNGATLRANSAVSDFALLELNQIPPVNSGITYSGWNRNPNVSASSVSLHHPAGDLMKISRDFNPTGVSSWGGFNNHWVAVFDEGTVEPGSSGAPLYDPDQRVIGQLRLSDFQSQSLQSKNPDHF